VNGGLRDDHGRLLDGGGGLPFLVEFTDVTTRVATLDSFPLRKIGRFSDDGDGFASGNNLGEGFVPLVNNTSGAPADSSKVGTTAVVLHINDGPCNGFNGGWDHSAGD